MTDEKNPMTVTGTFTGTFTFSPDTSPEPPMPPSPPTPPAPPVTPPEEPNPPKPPTPPLPPIPPTPPTPPAVAAHGYQIGINPLSRSSLEEPLINVVKSFSYRELAGFEDLLEGGHFDPQTQRLKSLLNPSSYQLFGAIGEHSALYPEFYAGQWVIRWGDEARIYLAGPGLTEVERSSNHAVYNYTGGGRALILIDRLGENGIDLSTIQVYRKEYEESLLNGSNWAPHFIDRVKGYHVIRMMDVMQTNDSTINKIEDQSTSDWFSWNAQTQEPLPQGVKKGCPLMLSFLWPKRLIQRYG